MSNPEKNVKTEAERNAEITDLVKEFIDVIKATAAGTETVPRQRTYWHTRLPQIPPELLAPALSEALTWGIRSAVSAEVDNVLRQVKKVIG